MKISLKMLLLTLCSFTILILAIIASLYLYFNQFYEPQKINHIITSMNEFASAYKSNQWTDEQLYTEVSKFMKKNNATMSIIPEVALSVEATPAKGELNITTPAFNATEQPDSITFTVKEKIPKFSIGTATNINGVNVLYPIKLTIISGSSSSEQLYKVNKKNGIEYIINTIPYTQYHQVSFSKRFSVHGENKITSVTLSLQSVDEVMKFLKSFFPYLIGLTIFLSVIMVAVYSKTITKPIVQITKISNRMALMELGIVSELKRKDELGALSMSLNTLSSNLKNTLEELSTAHEQLKTDYEQELKQEKARREFVANVSHELKSPLGIIKSYSEGIRDGIKAEKRDYYLEVILDEVNHMDQMLLEMLEISKFDAGAVIYHKKIFNLQNLIDKSIQFYIQKAADKGGTIEATGCFHTVYADEEKLARVMNNLLGNAVKYCDTNTVITIQGECTLQKQVINIRNDCKPFSEEALTKIWDRFYKADTSHNRDTEGTGLGLAITKSILEGHGSSYGAYNTESGVCFYFELYKDSETE